MHQLHEPWTANVIGRMHRYGIKADELARKCGFSPQYLSMILNSKKEFKTEKSKEKTKRIIFEKLHLIEMEVMHEYR